MKKIIETERIILRELEENDLNRLAEIYADIEVMRYIGKGIVLTYEQTKRSIENWNKYYEKFGFGKRFGQRRGDLMIAVNSRHFFD